MLPRTNRDARLRTIAAAASVLALAVGALWWTARPEELAPGVQKNLARLDAHDPSRPDARAPFELSKLRPKPFGQDPLHSAAAGEALADLSFVSTGPVVEVQARHVSLRDGCLMRSADGLCADGEPGDQDGDGVPTDEDCNDALRTAYPGATEVRCNGLDEDCDGVDLCPPDRDGDGVRADEDCDDTNARRSPLIAEIYCNGVDDDCSGIDACDRDGDGDPAPHDCDDQSSARHWGAKEVACDGVDQDCSGVDCCAQDDDGDGFACRIDCDDHDAETFPGAPVATSCSGFDRNCDGRADGTDCR